MSVARRQRPPRAPRSWSSAPPRLGTSGIEWSVALPFAVAALAGVLAGSRVASRVDAQALVRWFAASLVALSLYITTTTTLAALTG